MKNEFSPLTLANLANLAKSPKKKQSQVDQNPITDTTKEKLLALLAEDPGAKYAHIVDNPDTDPVIVNVAIRGVATFDLAIPREKWDPFKFLEITHHTEDNR